MGILARWENDFCANGRVYSVRCSLTSTYHYWLEWPTNGVCLQTMLTQDQTLFVLREYGLVLEVLTCREFIPYRRPILG